MAGDGGAQLGDPGSWLVLVVPGLDGGDGHRHELGRAVGVGEALAEVDGPGRRGQGGHLVEDGGGEPAQAGPDVRRAVSHRPDPRWDRPGKEHSRAPRGPEYCALGRSGTMGPPPLSEALGVVCLEHPVASLALSTRHDGALGDTVTTQTIVPGPLGAADPCSGPGGGPAVVHPSQKLITVAIVAGPAGRPGHLGPGPVGPCCEPDRHRDGCRPLRDHRLRPDDRVPPPLHPRQLQARHGRSRSSWPWSARWASRVR